MKLVFKKRHFAGSLVSIRGLRITFLSCIIAMTALAQLAQQGSKLAGMDSIGRSQQGQSVAISADGNTAIESGL